MNNQPPRPFVAPNEYERNKSTIASYRAYLDMYERVNEQGLRNHEEQERFEHMLQEQIRQGEEAKRQLTLLRQSGTRMRITDGQTSIPEVTVMTPGQTPVIISHSNVQQASSSAYIEEIHEPRVSSTNVSQPNYVPHSVSKHIPGPQPYYNTQPQPLPTVPHHHRQQYNQPIRRHVPTPPQPHQQPQPQQHSVQPIPNLVNYSREYQANVGAPQQSAHRVVQQSQVHQQNARPTQTAVTQAQLEQYRQLQHQNQIARQNLNPQQTTTVPPRYYPTVQQSGAQNRASMPGQYPSRDDGQRRQSIPQNVPILNNTQAQQRSPYAVAQVHASSNVSNPKAATSSTLQPTPVTVASSSLDGALGPPQAVTGHPSEGGSASSVPPSDSTLPTATSNASPPPLVLSERAVNDVSTSVQSPSHTTEPPTQIIPASSVIQSPPPSSSSTETPTLITSPMRTPKEADKKHLARDLLRALKRPPPEASPSSKEPERKRHAPESAVKQSVQPTQSTFKASPAITQVTHPTTSLAQQATPATVVSSSISSQVSSSTTKATDPLFALLQKYPHFLNALRAQNRERINRTMSSGSGSPLVGYAAMANGGTELLEVPPPPHEPQPKPQTEPRNLQTVAPAAHVPLQPLRFTPIQTPDQPPGLPSRQSSNTKLASPQELPSTTMLPKPATTDTPAPVPTVVPQDPPVVSEGSKSIQAPRLPETPIAELGNTFFLTAQKTPLFLPSPTSSPDQSMAHSAIVSSGKKDKGKGKAISSSRSPSMTLSPVVQAKQGSGALGLRYVLAYVSVPPLPSYALAWKKRQIQDEELDGIQQDLYDLGVASRSRSPEFSDYMRLSISRSPSASNVPHEIVNLVSDEESDAAEDLDSSSQHFASYAPSYISSQSADVILSDVRPFKLKAEALHAINVLLDEFLYNILNNAGSLSTDKLHDSLLGLLPTSLGKDALLEAEVELRAYWDRTVAEGGPIPQLQDDSKTFHLQWAFQLLRLKCEAYSTLNESDEDPSVEDRIQERFSQTVAVPPSASLLAPAALYLTAILEAMCEHILTNVGRVAARDSSRVSANVNDLFTALCEDDSIYGLFRSMRVYEQIELLSKGPVKSHRSKSFTRSELNTTLTSRTGSPHQDLSSSKDSISTPRSRLSSEASSSTTIPNMPGVTSASSRTSLDKARSLKLFKNSLDSDGQNGSGHKKSESVISEKTQDDGQRTQDHGGTPSLCLVSKPLNVQKVYKQDKDMRTTRRPAPLSLKDSDSVSSKRPSLRHVDSIIEDEEELAFPQPPPSNFLRIRQGSAATPASVPVPVASNRARSISTSSVGARHILSRTKPQPTAPSAYPKTPRNMTRPTKLQLLELNGLPTRTRKRQGNRESLDLDDVMAGSDDDASVSSPAARPPISPRGTGHISSNTRELMDFLAQGPPGDDFLISGPLSSMSPDAKPKGDRLRRMISKLSIGNGEKSKNGSAHVPSKSQLMKPPPLPAAVIPTPPRPPRLTSQSSLNGLSSLANRPIPPRPPRPATPPPDKEISPPPSPIQTFAPVAPYSPTTSSFRSSNRPPSPALIPPRQDSNETSSRHLAVNGSAHSSFNGSTNGGTNGHLNGQTKHPAGVTASKPITNVSLMHTTNETDASAQNRKVQVHAIEPSPDPSGPAVGLSPSDVAHLHRLMQFATSADECRLLLQMMLTKHKIPHRSQDATGLRLNETVASPEDAALERSLAGYFLGEEGPLEDGVPRVTSNRSSTVSVVSLSVYDDDSGVDAINPTAPMLATSTPLSINSDNNTLVGEMKA
ncbi:hypothetical protein AN958_05618 [Leucoagaricus sp. SymC.cos]|nr:hypothetical protein AN958_05618 [Leucoagaricus sp. SymC.cos]